MMALAALFVSSRPLSPPPFPPPLSQKKSNGTRPAVYVAAVPLRAAKGPAQMLMSSAYSLGLWDLQHFMVIIKPDPSESQVVSTSSFTRLKVLVFDFQPLNPENFYAAFAAVFQKEIPGLVLQRKLRRMPNNRCWFIGNSESDCVDLTNKFCEDWSTNLIVGEHDCRHFTNGLVEHLTGERLVLDHLRAISSG